MTQCRCISLALTLSRDGHVGLSPRDGESGGHGVELVRGGAFAGRLGTIVFDYLDFTTDYEQLFKPSRNAACSGQDSHPNCKGN